MYTDWSWEGVILVAAAILLVAGIAGMAANERKWDEFKRDHDCKMVGKMSGELFNTIGIGGNGQVSVGVGSTSDKTGWACNDGVTYWR